MNRDNTADVLNDLIETSKNGEFGFRAAAEYMSSDETRQLFMRRADECRRAAEDLAALVVEYGGTPEAGGTASGALQRGWMALKSKLTTHPDQLVLEEVEKGEDSAMEHYRSALEKALPDAVRDQISRQYEGVKRNHLQVRTLRDQFRAEAAAGH